MIKIRYGAVFIDEEKSRVFTFYIFDTYKEAKQCIENAITMDQIVSSKPVFVDTERGPAMVRVVMKGVTPYNTLIKTVEVNE